MNLKLAPLVQWGQSNNKFIQEELWNEGETILNMANITMKVWGHKVLATTNIRKFVMKLNDENFVPKSCDKLPWN